jgi:polyhydroxybutyrate depolymerase
MGLCPGCGDDAVGGTPLADAEPPADTGQSGEDDAGAGEDASAPEPCGKASGLAPGDVAMTLTHAGTERRFLVHVPASYKGDVLVPLVLDIHGLGGTAEYQKTTSGWQKKSDELGFLLVHPSGLDSSWHAGALCCGASLTSKVDDEGFLRALVAKVQSEACVDQKRVYATGLSNGGAMSHLLACRASDVFAAVAPISMSNSTMPCAPTRGISVTMFRATADELVAYDSPGSLFLSAEADFTEWKLRNDCKGEAASPNARCKSYTQCKDGSDVTLCTIPTTKEGDAPWGGHLLYTPAEREGVKVPDFVWATFERHHL